MLIPQSLAYALLAGLPPEMGLYASILPLVAYAIFGTSRTLAVGPVAVVSLMTAAAASNIASQGSSEYIIIVLTLAFLSGIFLVLLGVFKVGFLSNFISHPVTSGFVSASGLIIAISQFKHILGIEAQGHNLVDILVSLMEHIKETNQPTLIIGMGVMAFLFWVRGYLKKFLIKLGIREKTARIITKTGPVLAVITTSVLTALLKLDQSGVAIIGDIPSGLPNLTIPSMKLDLWLQISGAAVLISIIGFVESVSVAKTLAAKRREPIDPDQELIGIGAANVVASFSGGYPVTGGFSRSAINFDAGAETPAAGAFTAIGIAIAALILTPFLRYLPQATLGATIIVAVLSIVDLAAIKNTLTYSKRDALSMIATIVVTLSISIEAGVVSGVCLSLALFLYKTSKPHWAIVGLVPGTQHFRNVKRHIVLCSPHVKTLRVDESLYFANAKFLEDTIYSLVAHDPLVKHIVLMCPAVNEIDASAFESLKAINLRLKDSGVMFHLSEVKGPVMDRLKRTHFLENLTGKVFLSQYDALIELDPQMIDNLLEGKPE